MTPAHIRTGYFGIVLPKGAKNIHSEVSMTGTPYIAYKFKDDELLNEYEDIALPPGNWEIVCLSGEVSVIQAMELVEPDYDGYKDYEKPDEPNQFPFSSPIDSFHSLLRSKGLPEQTTLILKKQ